MVRISKTLKIEGKPIQIPSQNFKSKSSNPLLESGNAR